MGDINPHHVHSGVLALRPLALGLGQPPHVRGQPEAVGDKALQVPFHHSLGVPTTWPPAKERANVQIQDYFLPLHHSVHLLQINVCSE